MSSRQKRTEEYRGRDNRYDRYDRDEYRGRGRPDEYRSRRDHRRSVSPDDRLRRDDRYAYRRDYEREPSSWRDRNYGDKRDSPRPRSRERSRERRKSPVRTERASSKDHAEKKPEDSKEPLKYSKDEDESEDPELLMQKMMGFGSFGTTKGKKVSGANVGGVAKEKASNFRQYMNRSGGFNRELSPPPEERRKHR